MAQVWTAWRRAGPGAAARLLVQKLRGRSDRLILFAVEPQGEIPTVALPPSHSMGFASLEEVAAGCAAGRWSPGRLSAARSGDRCLLQRCGDRVVGETWVAGSNLVSLCRGVHLRLPDDVAYVYRTQTDPEFRGHDYQTARSLELRRRLFQEGKRRFFCYVRCSNFSSLRGVRKSGYRRVGDVHLSWGGVVKVRLTIAREYWADIDCR